MAYPTTSSSSLATRVVVYLIKEATNDNISD